MKHIMTSLLCSFALIVSAVQFEQGARIVNVGGAFPPGRKNWKLSCRRKRPSSNSQQRNFRLFLNRPQGGNRQS